MSIQPKDDMPEDDMPEKVNADLDYGAIPPPSSHGLDRNTTLKILGLSAVIALAMCFLLNNFLFKPVGMVLYNTNLANDVTTFKSINDKISATEKIFSDLTSVNFPNLQNQFTELKSEMAKFNVDNFATKAEVQNIQNNLNNLANNSAVTSLQGEVNTTKEQIKAVADENVVQDTKLTKLETDLKTAQDQIKALQATPTPTPTPTTSSGDWITSTKGQVTARLKFYSLWGSATSANNIVALNLVDGSSTTANLKLEITNTGTSTVAKDIQFALAFGWYNSTGAYIPRPVWSLTDTYFSVSSFVSGATFVRQTDANYSVFINQASSGLFSTAITLQPQETKTIIITITGNGNLALANNIGQYYLVPLIQVLDYTQVTN
jgi:hypothetical protein